MKDIKIEDEKIMQSIDCFFEQLKSGMLVDAFLTKEEICKFDILPFLKEGDSYGLKPRMV